ncbi:MAG: sugar phosphate isomerase/epimerase [Clostridia bacterium]|nr:sugar phosphate isomerase/epimerase [Clostridia bacterium]
MKDLKIYAFADEASGQIKGQIDAMLRNGLDGLEIRGVDGQNISDISMDKAREVRRMLDDAGLEVWSVGSPIGKISIESDTFPAHLDKLRHTLDLAQALGSNNLRMFSFYIPDGRHAEFRLKVLDWTGQMLRAAEGSGIALCHENEKGIYGDTADRCVDLLDAFPSLKGIFDPANYIQCGQDTLRAWALNRNRVHYLHIKDALPDGRVVPSGCGIGHIKEILQDFRALGGGAVTVEPHLSVFDGLKGLEQAGNRTRTDAFSYSSGDAAFDAACDALKKLAGLAEA